MIKIIRIALSNQKGGVGKTTISLCLAQELRSRGFKIDEILEEISNG